MAMAGSVSSTRCYFCHRPHSIGGHNIGCPVLDPTGENMASWDRGYTYGFDDNTIRDGQWRNYSASFNLGWRVGKAEIDRLVEGAFYSNYGYELDEED